MLDRKKTLRGVLIMNQENEMLEEYDFSNGIRGKYTQTYKEAYEVNKALQEVKQRKTNDIEKLFDEL